MRDSVSWKLDSLCAKRDRKNTPKGRVWELLDGRVLACGHYIGQAWRGLNVQTTGKTQKPLLFGKDCQHRLALMPMV